MCLPKFGDANRYGFSSANNETGGACAAAVAAGVGTRVPIACSRDAPNNSGCK